MSTDRKSTPSSDKNISIGGDVVDSVVISGDNNTVNKTTIIQKFFNFFKSDSETLEQRNRRILLSHVENAWIKGVLDASLYGAAMLDLGIKEDPNAVKSYPWTIKKESKNETLPAGTSMLEIFDSIGMGRSLLILGAPGSGKTTMLLELARGLIARAREDVTYPIPMVFNLSSWTESKPLADWLAQELNNLYSVPRKTAPDWVKGDKLLLLLDGLDEVRQESRSKCVEAINEFRKEHGLTSLAVCSRSQDYTDLNAKLSFEGAVEVQPLTQEQITKFFNRFGDEMAGIKQALEKDSALREMAETPLFLSITIMAYRDKRDVEILVSGDEKSQRKHLFDTYIERMFEHPRSKKVVFKKQDILRWLSWLAKKMVEQGQSIHSPDRIERGKLLTSSQQILHRIIDTVILSLVLCSVSALIVDLLSSFIFALTFGAVWWTMDMSHENFKFAEKLEWSWKNAFKGGSIGVCVGLLAGQFIGLVVGLGVAILNELRSGLDVGLKVSLLTGSVLGLLGLLLNGFFHGLDTFKLDETETTNRVVRQSLKSSLIVALVVWIIGGLNYQLASWLIINLKIGLSLGNIWILLCFFFGGIAGLFYGGYSVLYRFTLRWLLYVLGYMPLNPNIFFNHCVDLIFLRRVGGGYIFVHRLLMEHFAEMYMETPTSKGN